MAGVDVLTNRYSSSRAGANVNEMVLNQSNVNVNDFGKVFARGVDGQIYAQPLIVSNVMIPRTGRRSVVIVATTRNMVYAFDAENPEACHPIWQVNLDRPNETPVPATDYNSDWTYTDFTSEIGITSTPVIDRGSRTIYLTSKTKQMNWDGAHFKYRLHALDLITGRRKGKGPKLIAETIVNDLKNGGNARDFTFVKGPSVEGSGSGSVEGLVKFNAFFQLQRTGLLLQRGILYIGFGGRTRESDRFLPIARPVLKDGLYTTLG
jgi:hypothetical protein